MFKLPKQAEKRNPIVGALLGAVVTLFFGLTYHNIAAKIPLIGMVHDLQKNLEFKSLDMRFRLRGPLKKEQVNQDIVLLDMDDETLEWRSFPLDRLFYAEIVRALGKEGAGAKELFFDIFFYDPTGRSLDPAVAEHYKSELLNFNATVGATNADDVAALKEKLYYLAERLKSGLSPSQVAETNRQIADILGMEGIRKAIESDKELADFLESHKDLSDLAPDRDIVLRQAIKDAENVYLAQTFETLEKAPYALGDIMSDKKVHDVFVKMTSTKNLTDTRTPVEVKVATTIRNMTAEDYEKLLDPKTLNLKSKTIPFGKNVIVEMKNEVEKLRKTYKTSRKLSEKNSFNNKSVFGDPIGRLQKLFPMSHSLNDVLPEIGEYAMGTGNVKPEFQKNDGVARAAAPVSFFQDHLYPHVSFLMAMRYLGVKHEDVTVHRDRIVMRNCRLPGSDKTFTETIPLIVNGAMLINWAGKFYDPNLFPHRSFRVVYEAARVYNLAARAESGQALNDVDRARYEALTPERIEEAKKEIGFFKGKIALVGLTARGTHDMNPTPFESRYPLVGLHANFVNTLVNRLNVRAVPFAAFIAVNVALGLLIGFIGGRSKQSVGFAVTVGSSVAFFAASWAAFSGRVWLPLITPIFGMWLSYLLIVVYRYATEGQEAKRMKAMFSNYVSPSVVDTLIAYPEKLSLGGERMELTAMFAFATGPGLDGIEEAAELVDVLNEYFTAMTEPIFNHDGMLDKYEGYIIMAVFGCPIHYEDHPAKASFACVDMLKALEELNEKWKAEGKGRINVNIGLNTGSMIAGNMGSKSRFNYTVMGDSVNLSARLMGASMQYKTPTMISQFTYEKAKDQIEARFVDRIVVVGKDEPIDTYQILGRKGDPMPEARKKGMEAFAQAIELYRERRWDDAIAMFGTCREFIPGDGPSGIYIDRCEEYKEKPPPEGWQGEFRMTKK